MTASEKQVLNDIVNGIENLTVALDSLEAVLVRKGILTSAEVDLQKPFQIQAVVNDLAALRNAISVLPVR